RLAASQFHAVAKCFQFRLELLAMVALDVERAPVARAAGAERLLQLLQQRIKFRFGAWQPCDERERLAALARLPPVQPYHAIVRYGRAGRRRWWRPNLAIVGSAHTTAVGGIDEAAVLLAGHR